jgi:GNAT superfamily N-acetyltransferase
MIEYRKATLLDVPALTQLRVAMLCDGADYDNAFREKLHDNTLQYIRHGFTDKTYVAWVAADNGAIVAMGGISYYLLPPNDWCPEGKTAHIGSMYTLPGFRRQGIASRILCLLVEEAKRNGCERIQLNASEMGRPIYEDYGFEISEGAMAYYPDR